MSLSEASHWLGGHNSWLNICRNISNHGHTADSIYNVYIVQILWSEIPVSKVNSILAKLLLINKATETAQPALAQQVTDTMDKTFDVLDQRLIQIGFIRLILWTYDFLNTKFLHLNSLQNSYWKTLLDKTISTTSISNIVINLV